MPVLFDRNFQCVDLNCLHKFKKGKWNDDFSIEKCPKCGSDSKEVFEEVRDCSFFIGGKMKGGRSVREREERRLRDFKKNTLPTLTGSERKHFEKKIKNRGL